SPTPSPRALSHAPHRPRTRAVTRSRPRAPSWRRTSRCRSGSAICCSRPGRQLGSQRGSPPRLRRPRRRRRDRRPLPAAPLLNRTERESRDMATISAADVKKLRDATGAGMMDSKRALEEADGEFDRAVEILRVKGEAKNVTRGDRVATNGLVAGAEGAMI